MASGGATCLPTGCFCEAVHSTGLAQPVNAWSSLAFVAAGVVVFLPTGKPAHRERVLRMLLGATLVAVGGASFAFHATLTRVTEFLDTWTMAGLAIVILGGAVARRGFARPRLAVLLGLALQAILLRVLWTWPATRRVVFGVILAVAVALELSRTRIPVAAFQPQRWLWLALGLLTAAYAIWLLDVMGTWCDPTSLLQGHAVWHVVGAGAAVCLARHYDVTSRA
ncbi:MAG: ceramidase [Intrasporangium sp.]|uniref:ceramidase domain-containing protein n=1 Tax=Intrasporangium sp. TaxID=1925024 RepID=UPI00264913B4|nr:ceramidase domain-containing protein [Intrasporangium sp.]MDN5795362.1 ceramidase [Intrasporangium sp.]